MIMSETAIARRESVGGDFRGASAGARGCDADWFGVENVVAVGVMRNELSLVWT